MTREEIERALLTALLAFFVVLFLFAVGMHLSQDDRRADELRMLKSERHAIFFGCQHPSSTSKR